MNKAHGIHIKIVLRYKQTAKLLQQLHSNGLFYCNKTWMITDKHLTTEHRTFTESIFIFC